MVGARQGGPGGGTGERRDAVPAAVAAWLLDPERHGTSGEVAHDVLRLDAELRDIIARLNDKVVEANAEVSGHRRRVADIGRFWFPRRRAAATTKLNHALDTHTKTAKILEETRSLLRILRGFVIALDPEDGLLPEAAAGWARSPDVPAGVSVFEHGYFLLDTRRSAGPSGLSALMIGGEEFGELWRRGRRSRRPAGQPPRMLAGRLHRTHTRDLRGAS